MIVRGMENPNPTGVSFPCQNIPLPIPRERILALLDWRVPGVVKPAPVPPPNCSVCGQVMVLIGSVARKPP